MGEDAARKYYAQVVIDGENGRLTLENPIAPHHGNRIVIDTDKRSTSETVSGESTYFYQLSQFAVSVNTGKPLPTGGEDAVRNMQAIDAIYKAAGFRRPVID
jgi:predicted dehydrogenase